MIAPEDDEDIRQAVRRSRMRVTVKSTGPARVDPTLEPFNLRVTLSTRELQRLDALAVQLHRLGVKGLTPDRVIRGLVVSALNQADNRGTPENLAVIRAGLGE